MILVEKTICISGSKKTKTEIFYLFEKDKIYEVIYESFRMNKLDDFFEPKQVQNYTNLTLGMLRKMKIEICKMSDFVDFNDLGETDSYNGREDRKARDICAGEILSKFPSYQENISFSMPIFNFYN